jgi:hypothetical protein
MRMPWQLRDREGENKAQAVQAAPNEREGALSGLTPLHVDPDDDRSSREDVEAEKKSRRPRPGA